MQATLYLRPSVFAILPPHSDAAGLLLWARPLGDIDRLLHGRRSTAAACECGQGHVVSVRVES